jgi:hypothetical protein
VKWQVFGMTWDEYYEKFWSWGESTQIKQLSSAECNGKTSEIMDVAYSLSDDNAVIRLFRKAVDAGVQFTAEEIMDISLSFPDEAFDAVISHAKCQFTDQQLETLMACTDNKHILEIANRQGSKIFDEYDEETEFEPFPDSSEKRPGKLFSGAAFWGMLFENPKAAKPKFRIGDHVRVRYRGQEGTIVDINGNYYMVSLNDGGKVDSYSESQLEKAW